MGWSLTEGLTVSNYYSKRFELQRKVKRILKGCKEGEEKHIILVKIGSQLSSLYICSFPD